MPFVSGVNWLWLTQLCPEASRLSSVRLIRHVMHPIKSNCRMVVIGTQFPLCNRFICVIFIFPDDPVPFYKFTKKHPCMYLRELR